MLHEMYIKCGFTRQVIQRSGDLPRPVQHASIFVTIFMKLYGMPAFSVVSGMQCLAGADVYVMWG
jgi:hypothetical protein